MQVHSLFTTLLCFLQLSWAVPLNCTKRAEDGSPLVSTSLGSVKGVPARSGSAHRFTVPFAKPPIGRLRFASPQPVDEWTTTLDGTRLPAPCMQYDDDTRGISGASEDCLFMTIYTPSKVSGKLPVLVWVHGGSFQSGSGSASGLDGSHLAAKHNIIVVMIQYRLSLFGFFHTEGLLDESGELQGNQALRDVVASLTFLKDHIGNFGGNAGAITVAGQSSGAHMVRSLLSTPSASSLFHRAIMQSDPNNYGPASAASNGKLGSYAMTQLGCSDLACMRSKSASDILNASSDAAYTIPNLDASFATGEPWRPFLGSYVTNQPSLQGKQVILSTVSNEAGSTAGLMLAPTKKATMLTLSQLMGGFQVTKQMALDQYYRGGNRGQELVSNNVYAMSQQEQEEDDGLRINIERIMTDGQFKCSTWAFAKRLSQLSPFVFLSQHEVGIRYSSNADNGYCTSHSSAVCHEDDIYAVFGTSPHPLSSDQASFQKELQSRWIKFVKTGSGWGSVADNTILRIGATASSAEISKASDACRDVWGSAVQFDWQLYG